MDDTKKPENLKPSAMAYDDILKRLGEFGRYQRRIYFLLCLAVIPCSFHKLANVFLGAKPDYRCMLPNENATTQFYQNETIKNMTMVILDYSKQLYDQCRYLDVNYTDEYFELGIPAKESVECTSLIFDETKYRSSSVTEFLLFCNRAWLRATADSLFMVGVLIGSYIFGDLSDRCGRRPTFIISLILQLVGGLLTAIAPEYISFVLGRILIGATTSGVFLVAYVIALEMVGPSMRLYAGTFVHMFFSLGFLLMALIAYLTEDHSWRIFQVIITLFPGAFLMSYWWIIPESSRWLASKGRHKEAKEILLKVAKENKITLPDSAFDELFNETSQLPDDEEAEEKALTNGMQESLETDEKVAKVKDSKVKRQPNLLDLMLNPNLRRRSLNIFFNWFANSLAYYGLSWSTSDLGGNIYLNFCLSGIMEFPGYGLLLFTLNRFGRKFTLCGALLIGGTALLLTAVVPPELNWLTITLAMLGKLAITTSYGTVYIFSAEQFPTVIRNVGLGAASMSARIGGILAPYVNSLAEIWRPLPLIIYGGLALCAGGSALLLPETLGRTLPETIEEGEAFIEKPRNKSAKENSV